MKLLILLLGWLACSVPTVWLFHVVYNFRREKNKEVGL